MRAEYVEANGQEQGSVATLAADFFQELCAHCGGHIAPLHDARHFFDARTKSWGLAADEEEAERRHAKGVRRPRPPEMRVIGCSDCFMPIPSNTEHQLDWDAQWAAHDAKIEAEQKARAGNPSPNNEYMLINPHQVLSDRQQELANVQREQAKTVATAEAGTADLLQQILAEMKTLGQRMDAVEKMAGLTAKKTK